MAAPSHKFRCSHILVLFLLTLLVATTLTSSATISLYLFCSTALTLLLLALIASVLLTRHTPHAITAPFLVTHSFLAAFAAPAASFVLSWLLVVVVLLIPALLLAATLAIFFATHATARKTFHFPTDEVLEFLALPQFLWLRPVQEIGTLSRATLENVTIPVGNGTSLGFNSTTNGTTDGTETIYVMAGDPRPILTAMTQGFDQAGVSRRDVVLLSIAVVLILLLALTVRVAAVHAAAEMVKWRLFTRYDRATGVQAEERSEGARRIGVSGLAVVALTGAFWWQLFLQAQRAVLQAKSVLSLQIQKEHMTALQGVYRMVMMMLSFVLAVVIFLGSQLLIAVAHAERVLLGSHTPLSRAFATSVVYNSVMEGLRSGVQIFMMKWTTLNVVLLHLYIVAYVVIVWRFTSRVVDQFQRARTVEEELRTGWQGNVDTECAISEDVSFNIG